MHASLFYVRRIRTGASCLRTGVVGATAALVSLGLVSEAQATKFGGGATDGTTAVAATVEVFCAADTTNFKFCAGNADCCCMDNNTACDPVDGDQVCVEGETCANCCLSEAGFPYQSCCTGLDGACCGGFAKCTLGVKSAKVCNIGTDCVAPGDVIVTLCEDATASPCAAAGAQHDINVPIGNGANEMSLGALTLLQIELFELHIVFDDDTTLSAAITNPNPGPKGTAPCVPALPVWGVVVLVLVLLAAGTVVFGRMPPAPGEGARA